MTDSDSGDWPEYDGLGDEDQEELPPQEGDDGFDQDLLLDWLRQNPTGIGRVDALVESLLAWIDEQIDTAGMVSRLKKLRAELLRESPEGILKKPLRLGLTRLKRALQEEDEELALKALFHLRGELCPSVEGP